MTPATLQKWRARLGVSQASAAELLGVPVRTLQGWEIGRPIQYPLLLSLACSAILKRLKPYS